MISQSNGHSSTLVALGLNDSTSYFFLLPTRTPSPTATAHPTATGLATTANTAIASGFGQSLVLRQ